VSIKIFKLGEDRKSLQIQKEISDGAWIHLENPSPEEMKKFSEEQNIPLDFLTDPMDENEGSRVEKKEDCKLLIFRTSHPNENPELYPFRAAPLGIILKDNILITICLRKMKIISDFLLLEDKSPYLENKTKMVLYLLQKASQIYIKDLRTINQLRIEIENDLQRFARNEKLMQLLNLEKSLVYFTTSLRGNDLVFNRLQKNWLLPFEEDELDLLDDIIIDNMQALETTEIYTNILMGTMTAFAAIISNNLNSVMKFLAALTIVLMIPAVITSFYGMNVPNLPFANSPGGFFIILGICVFSSLCGILFFIRKKWF